MSRRRFLALSAAGATTSAAALSGCALQVSSGASGSGETSFGAEALPKGLTIDEKTGLISGVPQVPGTYPVNVKATNTAGTATQSVTLSVQNA
ncbi:Ig domain-containing protein [Streptomyces sp. TRM68367]|uniref:Ig domain-containing protein n=1 Tax=Streptomyces sp. TRM68367 TaxID=2758415 RepID=UPI0021D2CA17|nr:Ig domain-containing protein [Streptomyces sp. TRM68367]